MPVPIDFHHVLARAATTGPSSDSAATRSFNQARSHSYTVSARGIFSTSTSSGSGFRWPVLAAIVIPCIVVLTISSYLARRWRRSRTTCSVVVAAAPPPPPPPPPKHQPWNEQHTQSYNMQPRPVSTFQQHFVSGNNSWNAQPQPVPTVTSHYNNAAMGTGMGPGPAWGQNGQEGYNQQAHYDPYHSAPMRHPSTMSSNAQTISSTYKPDAFGESKRADTMPQPTRYPSTTGSQNQPGYPTYSPPVEENRRREPPAQFPDAIHGQWGSNPVGQSGQPLDSPSRAQSAGRNPRPPSSSSATHPQPQSPPGRQNNTLPPASSNPRAEYSPPSQHDALRQKGEIVLEWNPMAGLAPGEQRGGGSSSSQAGGQPDTPEMNVLRERVQRLEAALGEQAQVTPPHNDDLERPPPAYDTLPTVNTSGQNSSSRAGGRSS